MKSLDERLRNSLSGPPPSGLLRGDVTEAEPTGISAAVLIGVTDRTDPGVILTVRRDDLRTHAGQVAFPGGRIDPGEDSAAAALREAWEELNVDPNSVTVVGTLDPYCTVTGFVVVPVLGVVAPDLPLVPHDREVADWFEAPLAHLVDPANHLRRSVLFEGRRRDYYEIVWEDRRIWGATAAMLVNLSRRLQWP